MNFLYIFEKIIKSKLNAKRRNNRKINIKKKINENEKILYKRNIEKNMYYNILYKFIQK